MINKEIYSNQDRLEYVLGTPIKYNGLDIHPIKVANYEQFVGSIDILSLHPDELARTPQEFEMDYLTFLYKSYDLVGEVLQFDKYPNMAKVKKDIGRRLDEQVDGKPIPDIQKLKIVNEIIYKDIINSKLSTLFTLVFPGHKITMETLGEGENSHYELRIDDSMFINAESFEDIRSYILAMNDIEYDLDEKDRDYRDELDRAKEYIMAKMPKRANLVEQIHCFHAWMGRDYDYILSLTIKQFNENIHAYQKLVTSLRTTFPVLQPTDKIPDILDARKKEGMYDCVEHQENLGALAEKLKVN